VRPPRPPTALAVLVIAAGTRPAAGQEPATRPPRDTTARDTTVRDTTARGAALEGVVVTATRGTRRVAAEPTRVDVLDQEEIEEKTAMTPGNAVMLLSETGGVRVAATSPALGGANVRVQGLRGRYTQLLSDGLPLYGLSAEGLGLLQIPPVDLARVEVIKGAASALYGPAAMGGVVNFASRRPPGSGADGPERELYLNQTTLDGSDLAVFDARALGGGWGSTFLVTASRQRRRDLDGDRWSDVPGYGRAVVRPRLFHTGAQGDLFATVGLTAEDRTGGAVGAAPGAGAFLGAPFAQARTTRRADAGAVAHRYVGGGRVLAARTSATGEWRRTAFGDAHERDRRTTLFAEAALTLPAGTVQEWVVGAAGSAMPTCPARRRAARPGAPRRRRTPSPRRRCSPSTPGRPRARPAAHGVTSSARRLDVAHRYGAALSPRRLGPCAAPAPGLTRRPLGRPSAPSPPTPFVEEAEEVGVRRVLGFGRAATERARNASSRPSGRALGRSRSTAPCTRRRSAAAVLEQRRPPTPRAGGDPRARPAPPPRVPAAGETRRAPRARAGASLRPLAPGRLPGDRHVRLPARHQVDPRAARERRGVPLTPRHAAGVVAAVGARRRPPGLSVETLLHRPSAARRTTRPPPRAAPYVLARPAGARARRDARSPLVNGREHRPTSRQTRFAPIVRRPPGLGGRRTPTSGRPLEGR
jgi:iron complex outermembrane receptor protein